MVKMVGGQFSQQSIQLIKTQLDRLTTVGHIAILPVNIMDLSCSIKDEVHYGRLVCPGLPQSCYNSYSDCLSTCSYDDEAVERNGGDITINRPANAQQSLLKKINTIYLQNSIPHGI